MDSDAPIYSPLFGVLGVVSGIVFSCFGAAYGTARSGQAISALGVIRPELMTQSIIPVIMAGILAIYGLVVSAVIANSIKPPPDYKLHQGFLHLGAGLSVGLSCLASGVAIGTVGDSGVRALSANPKIFVSMVLILIFCEVLGLYGMILSLMLISRN